MAAMVRIMFTYGGSDKIPSGAPIGALTRALRAIGDWLNAPTKHTG